jgi:hypothetical protein
LAANDRFAPEMTPETLSSFRRFFVPVQGVEFFKPSTAIHRYFQL